MRLLLSMVFSAAVLIHAPPLVGQEAGEQQKPKELVLKTYDISPFVNQVRSFPFSPALPTTEVTPDAGASVTPQLGGGISAGGVGMGSQSSGFGQGLFALPFTNPQFGGQGGGFGGDVGGGQGGGFGNGIGVQGGGFSAFQFGNTLPSLHDTREQHAALISVIVNHVDIDSWEEHGGDATIMALNNTLLIRHHEATHKVIAALLKQLKRNLIGTQSVKVDLWWLPGDAETRRRLADAIRGKDPAGQLDALTEALKGFHRTVDVRDRTTGNVCNGHRVPLVVSRIPVVGGTGGGVGYQPVMSQVNVGLMAEVTPRIQDDWEGSEVEVSLRTALTSLDEHEPASDDNGNVDRFAFGHQVLETSLVCQLNRPIVAGTLSSLSAAKDGGENQGLTVVIQISK